MTDTDESIQDDFDAGCNDLLYFLGDPGDYFRINTIIFIAEQRFAAQLQEDSMIGWISRIPL